MPYGPVTFVPPDYHTHNVQVLDNSDSRLPFNMRSKQAWIRVRSCTDCGAMIAVGVTNDPDYLTHQHTRFHKMLWEMTNK